jgi:hypothetical protein
MGSGSHSERHGVSANKQFLPTKTAELIDGAWRKEMEDNCKICGSVLESNTAKHSGKIKYSCKTCGDVLLTEELYHDLPAILNTDENKKALLSHSVRKMSTRNNRMVLNTDLVTEILKGKLPSPGEQVANVILWLGENLKGPGEEVYVTAAEYQAIIGAKNAEGFDFILRYLKDRGLIDGIVSEGVGALGEGQITLSFEGWAYFENLQRSIPNSRKAFMAMKFGDSVLNDVVEKIFKPAVRQTGFELKILSDVPKAGLIDDRLRVEIRASRFLLADLSHDNPGAYWEAGYAEGLNKPVIYTCEKKKFDENNTHFDTNHHLTVIWDKDNLKVAAEELKATIRATLPDDAILTDIE